MLAQGNALGKGLPTQQPSRPERAAVSDRKRTTDKQSRLVPHIPFIELNLITFQERAKLVLKRLHAMMFLLPLDVSARLCNTGLADRKRTISVLPMEGPKWAGLSLDPARD